MINQPREELRTAGLGMTNDASVVHATLESHSPTIDTYLELVGTCFCLYCTGFNRWSGSHLIRWSMSSYLRHLTRSAVHVIVEIHGLRIFAILEEQARF